MTDPITVGILRGCDICGGSAGLRPEMMICDDCLARRTWTKTEEGTAVCQSLPPNVCWGLDVGKEYPYSRSVNGKGKMMVGVYPDPVDCPAWFKEIDLSRFEIYFTIQKSS